MYGKLWCLMLKNVNVSLMPTKAIWDARKELDQLDDLLNANSVIFRNSRWKVFGLPI
jgi:hypothetical protein